MSTYDEAKHRRGANPSNVGQYSAKDHAEAEDIELNAAFASAAIHQQNLRQWGSGESEARLIEYGGVLELGDDEADLGEAALVYAQRNADGTTTVTSTFECDPAQIAAGKDPGAYLSAHRLQVERFLDEHGLEADPVLGTGAYSQRIVYPAGRSLDDILDEQRRREAPMTDANRRELALSLAAGDGQCDQAAASAAQAAEFTDGDQEDTPWTTEDLSDQARARLADDAQAFYDLAGHILQRLGIGPEQWGRDLWLTRNNHGTGFWDRGWGEDGERLTQAAQSVGELSALRGDDGRTYLQ
jgi:hypothetical protein